MGTSTPLKDRLEAIRARKTQAPRIVRLYPSKPVSISPYVRMARQKALRPAICGGTVVPRGDGHAA